MLSMSGPARAYVLRGKYRQIILRVSADNKDEYLSTNVAVKPDRTLDLAVELASCYQGLRIPYYIDDLFSAPSTWGASTSSQSTK